MKWKLYFIYLQTPKKYIWEGIYKRDVLRDQEDD